MVDRVLVVSPQTREKKVVSLPAQPLCDAVGTKQVLATTWLHSGVRAEQLLVERGASSCTSVASPHDAA